MHFISRRIVRYAMYGLEDGSRWFYPLIAFAGLTELNLPLVRASIRCWKRNA